MLLKYLLRDMLLQQHPSLPHIIQRIIAPSLENKIMNTIYNS